jgi:hypothetical protein
MESMKKAFAVLLALLATGCPKTPLHIGGPCIQRRSDKEELCRRFKACGPDASVVIVGSTVCYTPDGGRTTVCPDPPPVYHCDGKTKP